MAEKGEADGRAAPHRGGERRVRRRGAGRQRRAEARAAPLLAPLLTQLGPVITASAARLTLC